MQNQIKIYLPNFIRNILLKKQKKHLICYTIYIETKNRFSILGYQFRYKFAQVFH